MYEVDNRYGFINYIKDKYNFGFNINYLETYSIDNFKQLLSTLTTDEIVELLTENLPLSSLILSTERLSTVKQQSNWTPSYFNSNEYVLYVLNNTGWIEIQGKKYSPKDIIKYGKLSNKLESLYGIQEKALIDLLSEDIVKRYNLKFKKDFSDFSSEQLFDILTKLPEKDKTGEISRKLYLDIIKNKRDKEPKYNPTGIKLIAKDGNFHFNNELIYIDKSIPQNIEDSKKIDIPIQQSTETIKKWFGVNKVELNLKMTEHTPFDERNSFVEEFKDLKICVLSMLDEDTLNYVKKLRRMKVIPCYEINAVDCVSNCSIEISDYSFIRKDGSFYFRLSTNNVMFHRNSHDYAMAFIEMFKEAVSPQIPMDLAELLISKNHDERRLIIEEKYGIDKWNSSYELLFEKSNLSKMIESYFRSNGLEEELINKISLIDFSSELLDEDFGLVFNCLDRINKDICDLNNIHATIKIDATDYIRRQCVYKLSSYRNIYKTNCYSKFLRYPERQPKFLSEISVFENYDFGDSEIQNTIHYSIQTIQNLISKKFPLFNAIKDIIDVDDIYNKNYVKCISHEGVEKNDFDYFIESSEEVKALLYFDSVECIIEKFLSSKNDVSEIISPIDGVSEINATETSTIVRKLVADTSLERGQKIYHWNGELCEKRSKEINARNENAGRDAEAIAYNELKKSYPKLIWNSKYTTIPADKNNQPPNNIVCDMWVHSNEGDMYFEVKSFISEFEMSINEYNSMKENRTNYYVVLVNRETKEISKHLFAELDAFKEPSKYKFTFKKDN